MGQLSSMEAAGCGRSRTKGTCAAHTASGGWHQSSQSQSLSGLEPCFRPSLSERLVPGPCERSSPDRCFLCNHGHYAGRYHPALWHHKLPRAAWKACSDPGFSHYTRSARSFQTNNRPAAVIELLNDFSYLLTSHAFSLGLENSEKTICAGQCPAHIVFSGTSYQGCE